MGELTLRQLSDNFQGFDPDKEAEETVLSNGDMAVRLNQNQMLDGETAKDSEISPSYAGSNYAKFKNRKNPRPGLGTPDLRNSGRFQNLMKFIQKGNTYFVTSQDNKTGSLVSKYGADIFGLQKINLKTFRNKNDKDFANKVKKLFK